MFSLLRKGAAGGLLLAATALLVPPIATAQDDEGPSWLAVRVVTTYADSGNTWVEQQRQLAEVRREGEAPPRHVWQVVRGELDTFHIVTFDDELAGYDTPPAEPEMGDAQQEWVAKIAPTVQSRSNYLLRSFSDLSIPGEEGAEPGLLLLRYSKVAIGKHGQFREWVKNDLLPALEKGGAKGINFNRMGFGGDNNVWVSSSVIENFAQLDGPGPLNYLSDEENAALFADFNEMVESSELRILRHRADMSN